MPSPYVLDPNMAGSNQTYYAANNVSSAKQQGGSTSQQMNQYNPGQLQLQQLLPGMFSSALQGGEVPSFFTAPQAVFDAANANFRDSVAPGLVARFGAGSPQLAGLQARMNQDLAANLYQSGVGNFLNYLNSAGAYATTPMGQSNEYNVDMGWKTRDRQRGFQGDTAWGGIFTELLGLLGA
jgi:hypothetical protein